MIFRSPVYKPNDRPPFNILQKKKNITINILLGKRKKWGIISEYTAGAKKITEPNNIGAENLSIKNNKFTINPSRIPKSWLSKLPLSFISSNLSCRYDHKKPFNTRKEGKRASRKRKGATGATLNSISQANNIPLQILLE